MTRLALQLGSLGVAAGALLFGIGGALAADLPGGAGSHGFHPVVGPNNIGDNKRQPAPPALPGAQTDKDAVTPSERPATDLQPTDALFDAINRGDVAAARDAINRGADLHGQNVLGMSPLDLSVDLDRNDITFLLLSMRAGANSNAPAVANADTPAPPTKAVHRVARAKPSAAHPAAPRQEAASHATPATASTPREYAGAASTGTPIPQMGFLGFGGQKSE